MTTLRIPLARIAHARSGDKADWVDFGLFAWNAAGYAIMYSSRVRITGIHFQPEAAGQHDL